MNGVERVCMEAAEKQAMKWNEVPKKLHKISILHPLNTPTMQVLKIAKSCVSYYLAIIPKYTRVNSKTFYLFHPMTFSYDLLLELLVSFMQLSSAHTGSLLNH